MQLNVLLNHYHNQEEINLLLKHLSSDESKEIKDQRCRLEDVKSLFYQHQKIIEKIHYTWLEPAIEQLSPSLRLLTIASLSPFQRSKLQDRFPETPPPLIGLIKPYILESLFAKLATPSIPPLEYLASTEMSPLAAWGKKELTSLCDYLGLYDLAAELKQIVDKTSIQKIYSCLTPQEISFLKICLQQKTPLTSPKLGIDPRKTDTQELRNILQQRGLVRLSKAFAGQNSYLVWLIAHRLDKGRGTLFLRNYSEQPTPKITAILQSQVITLMNFLKKGKS